jgi:O-methyltransferase involved in polyketide biosynthesis
MNNRDIKIDLGPVQETLMLPLWARARETEKDNPVVCDTFARDIVERIDYDFSWIDNISRWTKGRPILFMAAGVLCYFEARMVESLFRKLAETYPSAHVIFDSMSWLTAWGTNRDIMKKSGFDPSALVRWHLKRASGLRKWVDTIKIVEEYPMLSKLPSRNSFTRKQRWQIRIAGLFRLYNMIHVQLN